ncbi:MAG: hypothetical protein ACO3A2_10860 [Bdellovibrionia bacterium]
MGLVPSALAGDYAQTLGLGVHFFTGTENSSLTGSNGYSLHVGAEKNKGFFRPSLSTDFSYAAGSTSIASSTYGYSMYYGQFLGGFKVFAIPEGYIQPFLGVDGTLGSAIFKITNPPAGTDANTLGLAYGYVLSIGANVSNSSSGRAFRLQAQYWSVSSALAGVSPFYLNGFRFTLGLVF